MITFFILAAIVCIVLGVINLKDHGRQGNGTNDADSTWFHGSSGDSNFHNTSQSHSSHDDSSYHDDSHAPSDHDFGGYDSGGGDSGGCDGGSSD